MFYCQTINIFIQIQTLGINYLSHERVIYLGEGDPYIGRQVLPYLTESTHYANSLSLPKSPRVNITIRNAQDSATDLGIAGTPNQMLSFIPEKSVDNDFSLIFPFNCWCVKTGQLTLLQFLHSQPVSACH